MPKTQFTCIPFYHIAISFLYHFRVSHRRWNEFNMSCDEQTRVRRQLKCTGLKEEVKIAMFQQVAQATAEAVWATFDHLFKVSARVRISELGSHISDVENRESCYSFCVPILEFISMGHWATWSTPRIFLQTWIQFVDSLFPWISERVIRRIEDSRL